MNYTKIRSEMKEKSSKKLGIVNNVFKPLRSFKFKFKNIVFCLSMKLQPVFRSESLLSLKSACLHDLYYMIKQSLFIAETVFLCWVKSFELRFPFHKHPLNFFNLHTAFLEPFVLFFDSLFMTKLLKCCRRVFSAGTQCRVARKWMFFFRLCFPRVSRTRWMK